MKSFRRVASSLLVLIAVAGCASTKVTERQRYEGEKLARPGRIIVYDFAATPADIPAWSAAAGEYAQPSTSQSMEAVEMGRQLGAQVAEELVMEIRAMGLPAVRAAGQPAPQVNDIVIIGYFESIDEGSAAKRVVLGFGSGAAELSTRVEGYLMTQQGLRKLGAGTVEAGGGKGPGVAVPLAVTVATANPIGLIVGGAAKAGGEMTGASTIKGTAKRTAKKIADELRVAFRKQGWI
jgi:hypothetical protein